MAQHVAPFDELIASMASQADSFTCLATEQQLALAGVQAVTATADAAMAATWVADMKLIHSFWPGTTWSVRLLLTSHLLYFKHTGPCSAWAACVQVCKVHLFAQIRQAEHSGRNL